MLNQKFSDVIADFIGFAHDDIQDSLSSSELTKRILLLRKTVESVSTDLEHDKTTVKQVRKSVKSVHRSGKEYQQWQARLANMLQDLGDSAIKCGMDPIGNVLSKFSVIFGEMNVLFGNLMQSLTNVLFSPLDTFVKSELKVDVRKGFDKALREYEAKMEKVKKERQQAARESRMEGSTFEGFTLQIGDSSARERRLLQLQLCEFFITTTDVKARKQSYLVQYLSDFYAAQLTYFKESLSALQQLGNNLRDMADSLETARNEHERERRSLVKLRDELRSSVGDREGGGSVSTLGSYSLHQSQGNPADGTAKSGFLLKRSGSKVKKVWQKRRAVVRNGCFLLYHADDSRPPVSLPLLTCQVRPTGQRPCVFSLVSNNRTYSFQCETPQEAEHWVSVLCNAKTDVFQAAMGSGAGGGCNTSPSCTGGGPASPDATQTGGEEERLRAAVLRQVRAMPGNSVCADCTASDPDWISINLGVLICLECCGIHRELGVHISRTQSVLMDDLTPTQLMVSRFVGNTAFNEVFEAVLPEGVKPGFSASWRLADVQQQMSIRKAFIRAKYLDRIYVCRTTASGDPTGASYLARDLSSAVRYHRLSLLLQVFAEGYDLLTPQEDPLGETALHAMLRESYRSSSGSGGDGGCNGDSSELEDDTEDDDLGGSSGGGFVQLAVLEFALQNSPPVAQRRITARSRESLLHYCVRYDKPECLRVCLRAPGLAETAAAATNREGLTALELCRRLGGRETCARILLAVESGNLSVLDNPLMTVHRMRFGSGVGRLSSGASYPDLRSLCSEDAASTSVSRAESPARQSSGVNLVVPTLRRIGAKKLHRAPPIPAPPHSASPPPLPPLPTLPPSLLPPSDNRSSSAGFDSYDSVQIVMEAAMESVSPALNDDANISRPALMPPPKPKPMLKPKPKLTRVSMPPQELHMLASAASSKAFCQEANSSITAANVEERHLSGSTSF